MPEITAAAVQLDMTPAPRDERLNRISALLDDAVADGAQLVVLPEFFNTGYCYDERLYEWTESMRGATMTWMQAQAAKYDIHLAGTLPVLDGDHTYNAAVLVAPDGRIWRDDKQYPLLWERVFYRDGRGGFVVADTDIGRIGMVTGRDSTQAHLWQQMAARVDVLLLMQAAPDFAQAELHFSHEEQESNKPLDISWRALGGAAGWLSRHAANALTDHDLAAQAHWLGVPVVCAGGSGTLRTILPAPLFSVGALVAVSPLHWLYITPEKAAAAKLVAPMQRTTMIFDADGNPTARPAEAGDTYILQAITTQDQPPQPSGTQPPLHESLLVMLLIDGLIPALLTLNYRRGIRRQWGARMAPQDDRTVRWQWALAIAALAAFLLGRWSKR